MVGCLMDSARSFGDISNYFNVVFFAQLTLTRRKKTIVPLQGIFGVDIRIVLCCNSLIKKVDGSLSYERQ